MQDSEIIHTTQFYITASFPSGPITKRKIYLLYSRAAEALEAKIRRRSNRSQMTYPSSFHVRYEAYLMATNSSSAIIGVWQYELLFDFLPAFRLAKTLSLHAFESQEVLSPCQLNPCTSPGGDCHVLQNDPTKYVCLCKSGYSGHNCSVEDERCANHFCHSNSLCKPDYWGRTGGSRLPFCLCPLNSHGTRCGLVYDPCLHNPCQNNGTCYPRMSDYTIVYCKCDPYHSGRYCAAKRRSIDIPINTNNVTSPSVLQYFNIDYNTLDLIYVHQKVSATTPTRAHYEYSGQYAPNIVLLKAYSSMYVDYPQIYLLSLKLFVLHPNTSVTLSKNSTCLDMIALVKRPSGK